MVGTNSNNIYVSVTGPRDSGREAGYRKPQHTWLISIEQHPHHVPGTSHKTVEPTHYAATKNHETGVYTVNIHPIESEPGIIGNIIIAESVHASADQVRKIIEEALASGSDSSKSSDHEPEAWIRKAIRGLQQQKIAHEFNIDDFMTFAHGYVASRLDNEAPALMAYPKVHRDHEKKSNKHKFWVSHPMAHRTKVNKSGEALVYGEFDCNRSRPACASRLR